jgi:hypothetical protein
MGEGEHGFLVDCRIVLGRVMLDLPSIIISSTTVKLHGQKPERLIVRLDEALLSDHGEQVNRFLEALQRIEEARTKFNIVGVELALSSNTSILGSQEIVGSLLNGMQNDKKKKK